MARRGSPDVAFFLVDGLSILGSLTEVEDSIEAGIEEGAVLGDLWNAPAFTGMRMATLTQDGFYDDAVGAAHDALSSGPGTARVLCYGPAGTATGAYFQGWESAMEVKYSRILTVGALHKAHGEYKTAGAVESGKILRTYKAAGTTGASTGTPVDNGASASGAVGYLQYNATAGEANIRILESADNITYTAAFTFTKTASGHGAERLTTTGFIQRYTAVDVTTATATGSIGALNFFVGLYRGALTT